jgi:hypothetical protein
LTETDGFVTSCSEKTILPYIKELYIGEMLVYAAF